MNKTIIIGLDGATFTILNEFIGLGLLPNIEKLVQNGVHGNLRSTVPVMTAPAWTSFMTGKNPGRHGIYDFSKKIRGDYFWDIVDFNDVTERTLWDIFSAKEKKVVAVNVPQTYPPRKVNGVIVSGFGTPGNATNFTFPHDISEKLNKVVDRYVIDVPGIDKRNIQESLKQAGIITRKRSRAVKYLAEEYDWDVLMVVFVGMDRVQHFLWEYLDETSPFAGGVKNRTDVKKFICDYYSLIDAELGEIINTNNDANIFIVSDHGFGTYRKTMNLNNWLLHKGWLKLKNRHSVVGRGIINALKTMGLSKQKIYHILKSYFGIDKKLLEKADPFAAIIDWDKTKAFAFSPNGIYVNLEGRERKGNVSEGEYEDFRSEIVESLKNVVDDQTGKKIIYSVKRKGDLYTGDKSDSLPDIIINEYDESYRFVGYGLEYLGKEIFYTIPLNTGTHYRDGVFIACGPDIRKGIVIKGAEIMDILPTVLYLHNMKIDKSIDGCVLEKAIEPKFLEENPVSICINDDTVETDDNLSESELSDDEKENVKEKLKGLGYI